MTAIISIFKQNLNQLIKAKGLLGSYMQVFWSKVGIKLRREVGLQK